MVTCPCILLQPSQELWHSFDMFWRLTVCEPLQVPPACWSGADAASTTVPLQGLADAVGQLGVEGQAAVVAAAGALSSQHQSALGVGQTMASLNHTHQLSSTVIINGHQCHQSLSIPSLPSYCSQLYQTCSRLHWPARRSTRRRKLEIAEHHRRNATDFDGCSVKAGEFAGQRGLGFGKISQSVLAFWYYVARWGFMPFPVLRRCFNGILSASRMHQLSFCSVAWWYRCFPLWQKVEQWTTQMRFHVRKVICP